MLVRYLQCQEPVRLAFVPARPGFVWREPPTWGKIDELVAAKWQRMKIEPSELCTDLEFIRRAYLDLIGLPPTPDEVAAFLAIPRVALHPPL